MLSVSVVNSFGKESDVIELLVDKLADEQPVTVSLEGDESMYPNGLLILNTKLSLSACAKALFNNILVSVNFCPFLCFRRNIAF